MSHLFLFTIRGLKIFGMNMTPLYMPPLLCNYPKSGEFYDHLQYQRMLQFLMGLNDNYSQARSQILLIPQLPNVNQAYALVNQDESQKLVAGSSRLIPENMAPTAMFTSRSGYQRPKNLMLPMQFVITVT